MKKRNGINKFVIKLNDMSELSSFEREIKKRAWDAFWRDLIIKSQTQMEEDRINGVKHRHMTKSERLAHIENLAGQLRILVPKAVKYLAYLDVWGIEYEMEHELYIEQQKKDGCEIVYEPPRLPISEIIKRRINNARVKR